MKRRLILTLLFFLFTYVAAIYANPFPLHRPLTALGSTAVPDMLTAINPIDCGSQTPPVIGYEISKGQDPDDEIAFLDNLAAAGYSVGSVDISTGSIPSCVSIIIVMGLAGNLHLNATYSNTEANLLHDWVNTGHSLMLSGDWGTFRNETQPLFAVFGYEQAGSYVSDPSDFDPAGPTSPPNSWVIYQTDNFVSHPILNGATELQLQASSWLSPTVNVIVTTDGDALPPRVPVMVALEEGAGCVLLAGDSNWLTTTNNGAYAKRSNAQIARQAVDWLGSCLGLLPPPPPSPTPPPPSAANPPIFLPVIFHQYCSDTINWADIILVLDRSGSMNGVTEPGGPSKLEASRIAATQFLNLLTFPGDQAGIVLFHHLAFVQHALSSDRDSLISALVGNADGLATRIDLGLLQARLELSSVRRSPNNLPYLILLTDGLPIETDEAAVLEQASAAKAQGITIFTIGLGNDTNVSLLRNIATSPQHFYFAPSTVDLGEIHQQILDQLACH